MDQPSTQPSNPPVPDVAPPKGTFALSATSVLMKQGVTFIQNDADYSDDKDADSALTRYITFGDGTSVTLNPGQTTFVKKYTKAGSFKVVEKITDTSGKSFTTPAKTVTVTSPGKATLNTHTVYQGQRFTITFSGVPSGTSKIRVLWGDGYENPIAGKNQTIGGYYYLDSKGKKVLGKRSIYVNYTTKNGTTDWFPVGAVNVLVDKYRPVLTVTKPSASNRVKSWTTVRGTASDKGAGLQPYAYVFVTRVTGGKVYCFTKNKKWVRVYSDKQYDTKCTPVVTSIVKGKWAFKLTGLGTGDLFVDAYAFDRIGHQGYRGLHVKVNKR
ncbi:hypothetical protein Acy02nite_42900 [Actinoplanes cyaneus]|uniref:PKD domain-containing protein n=1 Tax=Actinoplanes cyaneus TaxID=52696 RepID=A0A919M8F0_9ACTN|nr:hypothetical protein Acy02nite_42900 [Actinoplanes cyaneus]